MSVSSATSRIVYTGNNSLVTAYAVPFYFEENAHLNAIAKTAAGVETVVTLTNHTGAGDPNGGTVRTAVAVPATSTLTIYREVPATQTTSYAENDSFPAASHERALDKLTLLAQQALRKSGAGIRVTESSTQPQPAPSVPNSVAGLDENGNSIFRTPQELVEFLPDTFTVAALPTQTGAAVGSVLATNGATASWTNEPSLKSLRITDGVYPYWQITNTGAPTDKQKVRLSVEPSGVISVGRFNNAETVGTNILAWDVNNNCGISQGAPQAKLHVGGGAVGSSAGSSSEIFRAEWSNSNNSTLRLLQVRNSTGGDWTTTTTRLQQFTDTTPQGFLEFNPAGLNYGVALGTTNGSNVNTPFLFLTGAGGGNNVGIGTPFTPEKLSVNGAVRIVANGAALMFTDQSGTTPYMVAAVDGNFYFTGTTAAGAGRSIFRCAMRSNSSPLQIDVPLKIGAAGVPLISVLKATVSHAIGTIAAGAFLELTSTVTGAIAGAMVHVGSGAPNNLILRGYVANGDLVSVMYHNPTAAPINAGTRSIDLFVFNV